MDQVVAELFTSKRPIKQKG